MQGVNAEPRPRPRQDLSATAFRVQFVPCNETSLPDPIRIPSPFSFVRSLNARAADDEVRGTHGTVVGRVILQINFVVIVPSPVGENSTRDVSLLIEVKHADALDSTFTTVETIDSGTLGYVSRTNPSGDHQLGWHGAIVDPGLAPGRYTYRFTSSYLVSSVSSTFPTSTASQLAVTSQEG